MKQADIYVNDAFCGILTEDVSEPMKDANLHLLSENAQACWHNKRFCESFPLGIRFAKYGWMTGCRSLVQIADQTD